MKRANGTLKDLKNLFLNVLFLDIEVAQLQRKKADFGSANDDLLLSLGAVGTVCLRAMMG